MVFIFLCSFWWDLLFKLRLSFDSYDFFQTVIPRWWLPFPKGFWVSLPSRHGKHVVSVCMWMDYDYYIRCVNWEIYQPIRGSFACVWKNMTVKMKRKNSLKILGRSNSVQFDRLCSSPTAGRIVWRVGKMIRHWVSLTTANPGKSREHPQESS